MDIMKLSTEKKKFIERGLKAAHSDICEEDRIWSRYSHDKVDIGEELAKIIRTLSKAFPLARPLRALSIGSSAEPQFRILETAFRGGLYLLDIDKEALGVVKERIHRQETDRVAAIYGDYNKIFLGQRGAVAFLRNKLGGKKVDLINLHHSLYYCDECRWGLIFKNLYREALGPTGAMHAVMMAAKTDDQYSTTWLYNHFAGRFFGCCNDQNLCNFSQELRANTLFKNTQMLITTHRVRFFVNDFTKFMAVVWMILLYPDVHRYTLRQRREIVEFVYEKFWKPKKPLMQLQDHLILYRGLGFKGLV